MPSPRAIKQPPAEPAEPPVFEVDKKAAQYIALRDRIKEIELQQKRQLEPFKTALDQLDGELQEFLDATGQTSARTAHGTVTIHNRRSVSLEDPERFMGYVMKNGAFELMDRRANMTACCDFAEEHGSLPPGVKLSVVRILHVTERKS